MRGSGEGARWRRCGGSRTEPARTRSGSDFGLESIRRTFAHAFLERHLLRARWTVPRSRDVGLRLSMAGCSLLPGAAQACQTRLSGCSPPPTTPLPARETYADFPRSLVPALGPPRLPTPPTHAIPSNVSPRTRTLRSPSSTPSRSRRSPSSSSTRPPSPSLRRSRSRSRSVDCSLSPATFFFDADGSSCAPDCRARAGVHRSLAEEGRRAVHVRSDRSGCRGPQGEPDDSSSAE